MNAGLLAPRFPPFCWLRAGSLNGSPRRPTDEVNLWSISLEDDSEDADLVACLSREEHCRSARFATPSLSMCFIRVHGWLRLVLGGYLGCDPRNVFLARLPGGKSCLAHGELRFNLSHTDVRALLVVNAEYELGVDVEEIRPSPEAIALARRWFSKEELRWINESGDKEYAFLRCWVCREAVLKAWGTGLGFSLDTFVLQPPPYPAVPDREGRRVLIAELAPDHECVAAVALCEP